jgi:hypothetical protein
MDQRNKLIEAKDKATAATGILQISYIKNAITIIQLSDCIIKLEEAAQLLEEFRSVTLNDRYRNPGNGK